jgi:hypothetical protein
MEHKSNYPLSLRIWKEKHKNNRAPRTIVIYEDDGYHGRRITVDGKPAAFVDPAPEDLIFRVIYAKPVGEGDEYA